jgi:uncharacterized repeat protein (TIGR03803 family)
MIMQRSLMRAFLLLALWIPGATALLGQVFTTVHTFDNADGANPDGLVQATNGDLYGTTEQGGTNVRGTVFKINRTGTLTTLYSFCILTDCADGDRPKGGLIQANNGDLYGMTVGGVESFGTIFKVSLSGTVTTIYSFCSQANCTDGQHPYGGFVQAADGDLYGTTIGGTDTGGTVFKITPSGSLTTLYSFLDGGHPTSALVLATNGDFYGITFNGGAKGFGGIFKITSKGTLTTVYSFCSQTNCSDGNYPNGPLIQATDGDLYGTTVYGGANGAGTVFKVTPGGKLTTLYSFCAKTNCRDGNYPVAGLVQATDGDLYGTTGGNGDNGNRGTVFKITPSGKLTTLHSFCDESGCSDGKEPETGLIEATNGNLYGTTVVGGERYGTLFSLSVDLGPFVKTLTTSGKVGAAVKILGNDLTGATSVTFNGVAAEFKVNSASEITATVPAGATTGTVQVITPAGTLESNVPFEVKP